MVNPICSLNRIKNLRKNDNYKRTFKFKLTRNYPLIQEIDIFNPLSTLDKYSVPTINTQLSKIVRMNTYRYLTRTFLDLQDEFAYYNDETPEDDDRTPSDSLEDKQIKKYFMEGNVVKTYNVNGVINTVKANLVTYSLNKLKNHFGQTMNVALTDDQYMKFLKWLKQYDKNFKHHVVRNYNNKNKFMLGDVDFIIKIDNHTFMRIMTQSAIKNTYTDVELLNRPFVSDNLIRMYIFGKNTNRVVNDINKIISENESLSCYTIAPSKEDRHGFARSSIYFDKLKCRNVDSVFLNDHIKDQILKYIDQFFNNKSIYDKRNLLYKTGVLLYGEPGTGKTTIANMIASVCRCNMVLINMSQFAALDIDFITKTINADDNMYVVVLEDIDCVIGNRDDENDDLENKKNVNKLLQFLDSTSSPSNVIFVATTNHIEKLDSAILRDGRFDLTINITDLNKEAAMEMCKSFNLSTADTNKLLSENMKDGKINPAKLQNLILQKMEPLNN